MTRLRRFLARFRRKPELPVDDGWRELERVDSV